MGDSILSKISVAESVLREFYDATESSTLDESLGCLVEIARSASGRSELASCNILTRTLHICQSLPNSSSSCSLLLSLKLLRNLCAGEIRNQNSFVDQNGVEVVSTVLNSRLACNSDNGIVRMCLQVLGNVSLAREGHEFVVWRQLFPQFFVKIARIRSTETCDPLCMIICTCCEGNRELLSQLCSDPGLPIVVEILSTASAVGFREDWLKLLLSRIFIVESHLQHIFSKLSSVDASNGVCPRVDYFAPEQAFLLSVLSDILIEGFRYDSISVDFALCVLQILKSAVGNVNYASSVKLGIPTGSLDIDVLGYCLIILRDICAHDGRQRFKEEKPVDIVDSLALSGLFDLLLKLLRDLEPPSSIRKAMKQDEGEGGISLESKNTCPYRGFRRDIVAVIGNCAYQRKLVQDAIRQKNGVLLMLQQCVTDEDNPFLREWGLWAARNLLEGNEENQRLVGELELRGPVDTPEISGLGLRVDVDQSTRRAKLVNIS